MIEERVSAKELWEAMRSSGHPFALIHPARHEILDANGEYAALLGRDHSELRGLDISSIFEAETVASIRSLDEAFRRGTLRYISGQTQLRRPDGSVITIAGWTRRIDGIGSDPLMVTAAVDADRDVVPDDNAWIARAPEAFGFSGSTTDRFDPIHERLSDLEQLVWRIGLEVRSAGSIPVVGNGARARLERAYEQLTSREREVVALLVAGYRVTEISQQLYLAPSTVRNHLTAVFEKFDVHSQVELLSLLARPDPVSSDDTT